MHHPALAGPVPRVQQRAAANTGARTATARARWCCASPGARRAPYEWVQHVRLAAASRHHARRDRGRSPTAPTPSGVDAARGRPARARPTSSSTATASTTTRGPAWQSSSTRASSWSSCSSSAPTPALAMAFNSFGLQLDPELQELAITIRSRIRGVSNGRVEKPAEGSWTAHYPELGTEPMSYEDSISPEFYELERDAIFKRSWLNVGRVEQLPRKGSYFTKELAVANTSVVIVRDMDGEAARVPQHLPPPRQQARVDRLPARGVERQLPAVRLQVPRLEVRPRRRVLVRAARRASSSTSTRPTTAWFPCTATCGRGSSS